MAIFKIQNYFGLPAYVYSSIFRHGLIKTSSLLFILVLTTFSVSAVNYYVDPSSPGSNQGTFADPWKSIADIPWSINYFHPGDTVFFKRGQQYTGTLSINSMGSSDAPIVFMPYGLGNAPLFQYNLANPAEALVRDRTIIRLNQCNYIVIDGFELTDATMPENDRSVMANVGYGVFIYKGPGNNGSNNIIKNLTISRLGAGVSIDGGSNNTITGCNIRNLRMIINTPNINWDDFGAVGIVLSGSDNTITHNYIQDCWSNSFDYQYDGGAIEMYGPISNNKFLYNTAIDNLGWMEFGSGTSGQALNNLVGYNLLINNGHVCWLNMGNQGGVDVRNLQLFNNNIIQTKPPMLPDVTSQIGIFTTPSVTNVITLKNNIFWLTTRTNITDPNVQPFNGPQLIHQNNLYHMAGGSFGFSLDASEQLLNQGVSLFMDITSSLDPATWNFNLKPASAAVNFGQNIGIDKDFFGQLVPFGGAPDAGIAENISVALPLEFVSCRGWAGTNGNTIEWVTTTDPVDHFEIEKSSTGNNFKKIANVAPATNTGSTSIQYQFIDNNALDVVQYYRVKAIEPGNTVIYSKIVTIKNSPPADKLIVSPNPVVENLYLQIPGNDFQNKVVTLINMSGIVIRNERVNETASHLQLNIGLLPQGAYVIKVTDIKMGVSYQTIFTK